MKDKMAIPLMIWLVLILIGLILCYYTDKMTTGSYYMGMVGCGIWLTLINIYVDK